MPLHPQFTVQLSACPEGTVPARYHVQQESAMHSVACNPAQTAPSHFYETVPACSVEKNDESASSLRVVLAVVSAFQSSIIACRATTACTTLLVALLFVAYSSRQIILAVATCLLVAAACKSMAMGKFLANLKRVSILKKIPTVQEGSWLTGQSDLLNPKISLKNWRRWLTLHPKVLRLRRIPLDDFIVVHHPETVEKILRNGKHSREEYIYSFLSPWLGTGLVANCTPECSGHRRLLSPALSSRHAARRMGAYRAAVAELEDVWGAKLASQPEGSGMRSAVINIQEATRLLSLDIILRCAYSCDSHCQNVSTSNRGDRKPDNDVLTYVKAVPRLLSMVVERLLRFSHHSDTIYWRSSAGREYQQLVQTAHTFTDKQIAKRCREEQESAELSRKAGNADRPEKREDFMGILQEARTRARGSRSSKSAADSSISSMSPADVGALKCDLETLVFAGHDTTATALMWILYYLARHPYAQKRCYREISTMQEAGNVPATMMPTSVDNDECSSNSESDQDTPSEAEGRGQQRASSFQELPYLSACVKEALRLSSVVPFIHRRLAEDTELAGHVAPSGTRIMVSLWGLHHNPGVWSEPEAFRPERFIPSGEESDEDSIYDADAIRHAFMPFSHGNRGCLGQRMAMEELVTLLGLLLQRYAFQWDEALTGPAPEPYPTIVMHSQNGLRLLVSERTSAR